MVMARAIIMMMRHISLTGRNGKFIESTINGRHKKNDRGDHRSEEGLVILLARSAPSNHILHLKTDSCMGWSLVYYKELISPKLPKQNLRVIPISRRKC